MHVHGAQRAASAALVITVGLAMAKVAAWLATGSLAVLSQAFDSIVDIIALGLLVVALRVAAKPADTSHHFGHAKAEHLAAFAETLLLGAFVLGLMVEAVRRLTGDTPEVEAPLFAIGLLGLSAAVDAVRATILIRAARRHRSDAVGVGAVNVVADVGTALVAIVSLLAVRGGSVGADAVGALIVAVTVIVVAVPIARRSVDVLMDRAPAEAERTIADAASAAEGVAETRRVRVRGDSRGLFADVVIATGATTSLERAHGVAEGVEKAIQGALPGVDVVVHVEPATRADEPSERVHAAASRVDGVQEIHNVSVHRFVEDGASKLHATLHAKGPGGMSVAEAHDLADRIEAAVAHELEGSVRVDAHIEPLEPTSEGVDVTAARSDLVAAIKQVAEAESDVIDCHEIVITAAQDRLSVVAHVRGAASLPLDRLHDASRRIEDAIHSGHPEVASVLLHFEPA